MSTGEGWMRSLELGILDREFVGRLWDAARDYVRDLGEAVDNPFPFATRAWAELPDSSQPQFEDLVRKPAAQVLATFSVFAAGLSEPPC